MGILGILEEEFAFCLLIINSLKAGFAVDLNVEGR